MYDPAKVSQAFDKLFRTYPSFQAGDGAEDALRVYFEAVEPYATGDILDAVENFITGRAPGVNPSFAPPAPAVASECRRVMNLRLDHELRIRKPALPPPDVQRTQESRERVRRAATEHLASLSQISDVEAPVRAAERKRWQDRVDARFAPDQDERAMAERLGYSLGDADGDRDVA